MQLLRSVEEKATKNLACSEEIIRPITNAYEKLKDYLDGLNQNKDNLPAQERSSLAESLIQLTNRLSTEKYSRLSFYGRVITSYYDVIKA